MTHRAAVPVAAIFSRGTTILALLTTHTTASTPAEIHNATFKVHSLVEAVRPSTRQLPGL